jgi:hypothetical protein
LTEAAKFKHYPGRNTLRRYHDAVLAPFWPCIDRSLSLDRSRRVHALARGGGVGLLDTFAPMMRWSPPTSASQHATVLREAGLITTREGRSVRHCRTVMGHQLANSPGY